jgi:GWxTD domain-containing protein
MALFDRSAETWGIASAPITPGTPEKPGLVNAIPGGAAIPVLHRLPSPALEPRTGAGAVPAKATPRSEPEPKPPTRLEEWAQGPVRWLLTDDERRELARPRPELEAEEWIRLFWARRDPNPETPANPLQQELEERVRMADRLLEEPGLRGSLTDRGHVLVLLGRPKSRRKSADLQVDTWFYRRRDLVNTSRHLKLPPVIRFQFRLDGHGHFRLHDEVPAKQREAQELLRWYPSALIVNPHLTTAPVPPLFVGVPAASPEELAGLASQREHWPSGGLTAAYPEAFPGQALRWWVVCNLPRDAGRPRTAIGMVLDRERTAVGSFHLDLTPTARDNGWSFDLSLPVPDTRSTLMLEILSGTGPVAARTLVLRLPLAPPQATVITPAIFGTELSKIERYHPWTTNLFGGYHLDPRPDGRFRMGERVYFFFRVIHPGRPKNGLPCVDVGLRLLRGETPVAAAHWPCHELSMMSAGTYLFGSSFTLSGLDQPGQYGLELTIREPVSGAVQITSRPITVEP